MKKEPKMDLLTAAWDICIQHEHAVCKEKRATKLSFSVNWHMWLLTPYLYLRQDRQALVHYMPSSFLTF